MQSAPLKRLVTMSTHKLRPGREDFKMTGMPGSHRNTAILRATPTCPQW